MLIKRNADKFIKRNSTRIIMPIVIAEAAVFPHQTETGSRIAIESVGAQIPFLKRLMHVTLCYLLQKISPFTSAVSHSLKEE